MRTWIFMKRDVRQKNKRWSNGLFAVFIFWALHSNIFKFHPLGLGFLPRWLITSRFFAICLSSYSSLALWSYLRASLCSREDCTHFFSCALWIFIWTFQFVQSSTRRSHPLKVFNQITFPQFHFESTFPFIL